MSTASEEERTALAARLRTISTTSQLAAHAVPLRSLADALDGDTALAPWSSVDLAATFTRPELLSTPIAAARRGWATQVIGSALVFVPIIVTWIGLVLATNAYQHMIRTPEGAKAAAGRSFLELWQEGFGGHLAAAFTFGWMAIYTVATLFGIVTLTLLGAHRSRTAEQQAALARESVVGDLVPVLIAAQVAARAEEQDSPARFTAELARAGDRLGSLLEQAAEAQTGLTDVVVQVETLMSHLFSSVDSVKAAAADLSRGSAAVEGAVDAASAATAVLQRTVTEHVTAGVDRISLVTAEAAEHARTLGETGRRVLDEVGGQVERQLAASAQRQRELLDGLAGTVDAAVDALRDSTDRLSDAGGGLSRSLGDAGREGAEAIADTYRDAVAAAATSLGREMKKIGAGLADQVEELRAVTERHEGQARAATEGHVTAVADLIEAVQVFQSAMRAITEQHNEKSRQTAEEQGRAMAGVAAQLAATIREFEESARAVVERDRETLRAVADQHDRQARVAADQTRTLVELADTVRELRAALGAWLETDSRAGGNGGAR